MPAALAAVLLLAGCGEKSHPALLVGAVEDAAKWNDPPAKMRLAERANYRAIVLSSVWTPPLVAPSPAELSELRGAVEAAVQLGIRPIVAVYSFGADTPLTPEARRQFASYAASILRELPEVHDLSIGNEPNSNLFWQPQFGADGSDAAARSYFQLLLQTYDALKDVDPSVNVIGGSLAARGNDKPNGVRQSHSPTAFLEDLGADYRASGRSKPIMDMFSIHPYPENSSVGPDLAHPHSTSIGIADYAKLVRLLEDALGGPVPIVYGEYGVDTEIPRSMLSSYTAAEPAATRPVSVTRQGLDYAEAIRLAACQPLVRMLFFFHVSDEPQLDRLQTGVYYADDRPKPNLPVVAAAAQEAESGRVQCSK